MVFFLRPIQKASSFSRHLFRYFFDLCAAIGSQPAKADRVALIKVDGIGDFILWLETARALREHYRGREIVLIANALFAELAGQIGFFDRVIEVDLDSFENKWGYRARIIRQVFRLGAETAIQTTYSRNYTVGDALVRATGAREKIGSTGDLLLRSPWQRAVADRWYTQLIPAAAGAVHEVDRNLEFLRGLGVTNVRNTLAELPPGTQIPHALIPEDDFFVIFPGAGNTRRMWPVESFAAVVRAIVDEFGWRMLVCGTAGERERAERLVEQTGLSGAVNLAGQTSLPEFVEIVRRARLLIGNETSAIHIAAAVKTPSVCLLGGGHFNRFLPCPESLAGFKPLAVYHEMDCFGCDWRCRYHFPEGGPVPCISAITPASVIEAVHRAVTDRIEHAEENH